MHGFYYEFPTTLSATVCYCLAADQTLSLHFIVGWFCFCGFCFYDNASQNQRKIVKSSLILTIILIFIISPQPFTTDANPDEKGA